MHIKAQFLIPFTATFLKMLLIFQRDEDVDLCACLISGDVEMVMLRGRERAGL